MQAFSMQTHSQYIQKYKLFHSQDFHAVQERISHYLCAHEFKQSHNSLLDVQLYGFKLGNSALFDLQYSAPVKVVIDARTEFYFLRLTLDGHCQVLSENQQASQHTGEISVSNPGRRNKIVTNQQCRNLVLKLSKADLEQQLADKLAYRPLEALVFNAKAISVEEYQVIVETIQYILQVHYHGEAMWENLAGHLTDYLLNLLLLNIPNNYSNLLKSQRRQAVLPAYMRQAKQYLDEHLQDDISMEALSSACGVAQRTLQKGFMQFFQLTPVAYLRERRLQKIHDELLQADACVSVTDVLMRNGINSIGHFSKHYKSRFGCLPSQTLKKWN